MYSATILPLYHIPFNASLAPDSVRIGGKSMFLVLHYALWFSGFELISFSLRSYSLSIDIDIDIVHIPCNKEHTCQTIACLFIFSI